MSVVAIRKIGKGKFEIASDSIRIAGWFSQEKDKNGKLWKIGHMIMGTAGSCSIGSLLREYLENHQPKTNTEHGWVALMADFTKHVSGLDSGLDSGLKASENEFLVIWRGRAFFIHNFYVLEIKDFYAIGAGRDFAFATLYLNNDVKKAVEVACELSTFCEKPIKYMRSD